MTPHFSRSELQCRCGCKLARFHPGFLDSLETLRVAFGRPMVPSSACRCSAHNRAVSVAAPERSLHIGDRETRPGVQGCLAIDITLSNGFDKGELFSLAWSQQWSIGWNKNFLHLDRRVLVGMPQVTFEY